MFYYQMEIKPKLPAVSAEAFCKNFLRDDISIVFILKFSDWKIYSISQFRNCPFPNFNNFLRLHISKNN